MKIVFVSNNYHDLTGGGEAERTFQMAKQLIELGDEVSLISIDDDLSPQRKAALKFSDQMFLRQICRRFRIPLISLQKLFKLVREAEHIHFMGYWSTLNFIVFIVCLLKKRAYSITPAGSIVFFGRSLLLKKFFHAFFGRYFLKGAAFLVAITEDEKQLFLQLGYNRILKLSNGVDLKEYSLSIEKSSDKLNVELSEKHYILYLGRLNKIKGVDLLVNAFTSIASSYPDLHLVLAGPDENLKDQLAQIAKASNLASRVHFVGILRGRHKVDVIRNSYLVCIPSRKEAMSIVALEAGACGKSVVMTDQCGFEEIQKHDLGWICPATSHDLAQALREAASNQELVSKRGNRLFDFVRSHYTWEKLIQIFRSHVTESIRIVDKKNLI